MDISNFIPSTDNLYKFLFISGIILIAFSFIYPLEKEQFLDLEINTYNKEVEILNEEINILKQGVKNLENSGNETIKALDSLSKIESKIEVKAKIIELKDKYNKAFSEIKNKEQEAITKNIILNYDKKKILILQNHLASFECYRILFLISGSLFALFGLPMWIRATYRTEKLIDNELKEKRSSGAKH